MPSTPLAVRDEVDTAALRPVVYEGLALSVMGLVLGLATLLPGVSRTVPGLGATIRALVIAIGTVAIVVWLAHSIPAVVALVRAALVGPEELVADAGRIGGALVAFLAVLVAYRGLAGVIVPAFGARDAVWAYDLAFLVIGLAPLALIANRCRRNLDALADLATAAVIGAGDRPIGTESSDTT